MTDRVIALIDMDCFYVQVEQRLDPSLKGKPCAVVQYNNWKGGGIIAVSYEARDCGVSRSHRGDEAKKVCPEIELVRVPEANGKADLTKYRTAGHEVIEVISQFAKCVERASVDEAYIDLTEEVNAKMNLAGGRLTLEQLPGTFVVGCHSKSDTAELERKSVLGMWLDNLYDEDLDPLLEDSRRLAIAAAIVEEMRAAIFDQAGFRCSAGIAHNKMLSKLACGLHKPNRQTILPQQSVPQLFISLPLNKVRNLGGKMGKALMEQLGCQTMADIGKHSKEELQRHFGEKSGSWLLDLARGIDNELVKSRQLPQSIGCSKNFPGKQALASGTQVKMWLGKMATELEERLLKDKEANKRIAKSLSVYVHLQGNKAGLSRACGITSYNTERFVESSYAALEKLNATAGKDSWKPPIVALGMAATKFQDFSDTSATFLHNFMTHSPKRNPALLTLCKDDDAKPGSSNADMSPSTTPIKQKSEQSRGESSQPAGFFASRFRERMAAAASGSPEKSIRRNTSETACTKLEFASSIRLVDAVRLQPGAPKVGTIPPKSEQDSKNEDSETLSSDIPGKNRAIKVSPSKPNIDECTKIHLRSDAPKPKMTSSKADFNDVDPEVLACLPSDIQAEIRLQLGKKNTVKTSADKSDISGYFKTESVDLKARAGPSSEDSRTEDAGMAQHRVTCPKCKQPVLVWEQEEHDDYHMALDLQAAMNGTEGKRPIGGDQASKSKGRSQSQVKRKKQPARAKKGTPEKGKKLKSITSFFKSEGTSSSNSSLI